MLIIFCRIIAVCKWLINNKAFLCEPQNFSMVFENPVLCLFYCLLLSNAADDISLRHLCSPTTAKFGQQWLLRVVFYKCSLSWILFVIYAQRQINCSQILLVKVVPVQLKKGTACKGTFSFSQFPFLLGLICAGTRMYFSCGFILVGEKLFQSWQVETSG